MTTVVDAAIRTEALEPLTLKGISRPVTVYNVVGLAEGPAPVNGHDASSGGTER
jgi:class 3 adenylate cyclase